MSDETFNTFFHFGMYLREIIDALVDLIIILYIYHVLINALSAHMIHINLNTIFYTHVEHSPTKTIYIKYYKNIFYSFHHQLAIVDYLSTCRLVCAGHNDSFPGMW